MNNFSENICDGLVVKNYREFCRLLGEDIKTGNAKISQMKDWRRFFEYRKEGRYFYIDKVYSEPLTKKDGRAGRAITRKKGEILNLIEPLILDLICNKENRGELIASKLSLFQSLGMIRPTHAHL